MIRIEIEERVAAPEKRYRVVDVAKATGKTEGQVNGYFSNRGSSTKNGLTLQEIVDCLRGKVRGEGVRWTDVDEIRDRLRKEHGIRIVEE